MRNVILLAVTAFAVTLAIIVANRLSNEAMAVVVGALCGISASIPVSIGLIIAASHNWGRAERESEDYVQRPYMPQPPVVIITPPQNVQSPYGFPQSQFYLTPGAPAEGAPRDFKIVGDE